MRPIGVILLLLTLLAGNGTEVLGHLDPSMSPEALRVDVKKPVLVVYRDRMSLPANLLALSIKYRAVKPEFLEDLDPFDFSAIIFDYGVGHDEVRGWLAGKGERFLRWLEAGGAFLDFTSGEDVVFFDLEVLSPQSFEVNFVSDHPILKWPNFLLDATPTALAVFAGRSVKRFQVVMEAGGKPTLLVREIGKGRVVICGLYGIGSWFKGGFVENALYWATRGNVLASVVYAMRADTEHFAVLYPTFANESVPSIIPCLDEAYSLLTRLSGRLPYEGARIVLDFTEDIYWRLGIPASGLAGNPTFISIWMLPEAGGDQEELICVLFHELGHVFLGNYDFISGDFSEMLAEISKLYLLENLGFKELFNEQARKALEALRSYEEEANFSRINTEVLTGMMLELKEKYGWNMFKRYFKLVNRYTVFPRVSLERKINAFVYLLSIAAGEDLTGKFRDWGFPVEKAGISCYLNKNWTQTGEQVRIFGVLDPPFVGVLFIEYRRGSGRWKILGVTSADDFGCYEYRWIPIAEGKYEIRVRWVEEVDMELARSEVRELVVAESFHAEELGLGRVLLVLLNPIGALVLILFILYLCRRFSRSE